MQDLQEGLLMLLNTWKEFNPVDIGITTTVLGSLFCQSAVMDAIGVSRSEKESLLTHESNEKLRIAATLAIGESAREVIRKQREARN